MTNIVDSFVLEFGLDPSKFTAGQNKTIESLRKLKSEAESAGKDIEQTFDKRIRQSFSSLKREALGFVAAAFGANGIKQFIADLTNSDAAVGRLSRTLGVGTKEISRWQGLIEQVGGSAQDVAGSMQGLNDKLKWFTLTGQGDFLQFFKQLGVNPFDANRKLKDVNQLFIELAKSIKGMDPGEARSMLSQIGIDGNTINLMIKYTDQLGRLLEEQGKLREVNERAAIGAENLQGAWNKTTQAAIDLGSAVTNQLSPYLITALGWMEKLFVKTKEYLPELAAMTIRMSDRLKAARDERERLSTGTGTLGAGIGRLGPAITAIPPAGGFGSRPTIPAAPATTALQASAGGRTRAAERNNNPGNIEYGPFAIQHGATGTDGRFAIFPSLQHGRDAIEALLASNQNSFDPSVRSALAAARASMAGGEWLGARAPGGAGGGAAAAGGGSVVHATTTIGTIVIHTEAKDGEGIARDIGPQLRRQGIISPVNIGQE